MSIVFSILFLALFLAPIALAASGRLRWRWAILLGTLLVVGTFAGLTVAYIVFLGGQGDPGGTVVGDADFGWFMALVYLTVAGPMLWYLRRHGDSFKRMVLAFGSTFDPRLAPRGPMGRLGSNKYLSGTKPPTGSKRLAAWRNKIFDMGPDDRPKKG